MEEKPQKSKESCDTRRFKEFKEFKEKYETLRKKYDLPDFKFMNENFEIENVACEETELLAKKIRKQMMEKISLSFHSLEMLKNPQNAPLFIFSMIKSFSPSDKDNLELLYNKFAGFEIEAFGLETYYDEKKEIEFIKKVCKEWKEVCSDFNKIYESMKSGNKPDSKKHQKSYFG